MSRIGKKTISVPKGVTITLDGQNVTVKGPKGERSWTVAEEIEIKQEGDELSLTPRSDTARARAMWGLSRTLVDNMVVGVTSGFEKSLELVGVGYRAAMKGNALSLQLGFSHDVDIDPPAGVTFAVPKQTEIKISGSDKQGRILIPQPLRDHASLTRDVTFIDVAKHIAHTINKQVGVFT